ncbi:MAG: stage III sporulation AC/AD family protein [Eubacteriales bacterium]|nr:stage III sporulation AC/AD family protein [Eubacteriales bacterium]
MTFFQICVFAVCGLVFAIILKSMNSSFSIFIIAAITIITAGFLILKLNGIIVQFQKLLAYAQINQKYINLLLKIIGMTYVTHFTAGLFKDNGYMAAADLIEVLCRVSVAALSLPVVLSLFETVAACI